jgi:hypothetical protein
MGLPAPYIAQRFIFLAPVYFVSDLLDDVGARGFL